MSTPVTASAGGGSGGVPTDAGGLSTAAVTKLTSLEKQQARLKVKLLTQVAQLAGLNVSHAWGPHKQ